MDEALNARVAALEARLTDTEAELAFFREALGSVATLGAFTDVEFYVFPGGQLPVRQTELAIGYDAYARAVVDPLSKPRDDNPLRRTMADFDKKQDGWESRLDDKLHDWLVDDPINEDQYAVSLPPGERLMVGLGYATSMAFPLLYWVAPRSGYAARGITVANSPGTVDPDYRGEAGALVENNSENDFVITRNMRIVQVIFMLAMIPGQKVVPTHDQLGPTGRGVGGFGSTGTH